LYPLRDYFGGVAHKGVKPETVLRVNRTSTIPLSA
jgi:hypothetical protein